MNACGEATAILFPPLPRRIIPVLLAAERLRDGNMAMRGKFITLEGGEGTGKSTQAKRLVEWLNSRGVEAVATREVGGCPNAEAIRDLWLSGNAENWDPLTEALLVTAARREHLVKTVWPALERGIWVVSDRFADSTHVYQGIGLGLGMEVIDRLYSLIAADFRPDLTLLLDVEVDTGMSRMAARRGPDDRYQQRGRDFHEKLRRAFLDIASREPERFAVIDAGKTADEVAAQITAAVSDACWAAKGGRA